MLLPRIITALIGIPLALFLVHQGSFPYLAFIFLVIILALYEYRLVLRMGGKHVQAVPLFLFGIMLAAVSAFDRSQARPPGGDNLIPLAITLAVIGCFVWEIFSKKRSLERISLTLLGIFFVSWTLIHMFHLRDLRPYGEYITYLMLVSVWIMDTAAYAAGSSFGKHKLAETISPKKTWEGAIAGFAGSILSVLAAVWLFPQEAFLSFKSAVAIGCLIGVIGQLSDLAESVIKRAVGVKDSSGLLPGHGGVLDRFDSFILLAPALYYFFILVN